MDTPHTIGGVMNHIIKLVIEYKTSKSDFIFEDLVHELSQTINRNKNMVPQYHRDDFSQELLECLVDVISKFQIKKVNTISISLLNENNYNLLCNHEFKNINTVFQNRYISGFVHKYGIGLILSAFESDENSIAFLFEFELFCNENQFIKYVNTAFFRKVKQFYRKLKREKIFKFSSLNKTINDDIELLELIEDVTEDDEKNIFYDETVLTEEDRKFLHLFHTENRINTEKDVASILGVSQQAVSAKLKRLRKRYIKAFHNKYRKVEK